MKQRYMVIFKKPNQEQGAFSLKCVSKPDALDKALFVAEISGDMEVQKVKRASVFETQFVSDYFVFERRN